MGKKMGQYKNPIPATDIIIEYDKGIVLIERKNPPYGIALPGGFAEFGISFGENAIKEAKEETNLDVIIENEEIPFCIHSNPNRDPRTHIVNIVYIAKGYGILRAGDDAKKAYVYSLNEIKDLIKKNVLAFDHGKILTKYLNYRGEIL